MSSSHLMFRIYEKDSFYRAMTNLIPIGYLQRSFPFHNSDAQRHLPIDVNRSSKLWEWFTQTEFHCNSFQSER
ncbi:6913_t:CDS:2 [Rhizophagus irregularis]|nr:6913_t:CDS:2 [Rhizophagus irregularis]